MQCFEGAINQILDQYAEPINRRFQEISLTNGVKISEMTFKPPAINKKLQERGVVVSLESGKLNDLEASWDPYHGVVSLSVKEIHLNIRPNIRQMATQNIMNNMKEVKKILNKRNRETQAYIYSPALHGKSNFFAAPEKVQVIFKDDRNMLARCVSQGYDLILNITNSIWEVIPESFKDSIYTILGGDYESEIPEESDLKGDYNFVVDKQKLDQYQSNGKLVNVYPISVSNVQ